MKKVLSVALLILAPLISLAWIMTHVLILRPFEPQTPGGVALAYQLRAWSGTITLLLLLAGGWAALQVWRRSSWKGRVPAVLSVLLLAGFAYLARQSHFEWMFRPLLQPAFVAAGDAGFVAETDLVLGVASGSESRAYPVRALAYHHVVNDVIAGEPIVATY